MGNGNIARGVAGAAAGGLLAHQLQKEKEVSTPWERFALGGGITTFGLLSGILGSMIGYPVEGWFFGGAVMLIGLYTCVAAWGFTPTAFYYIAKGVPVRVARLTSGIPWKNTCEDGKVFAVGRRRKHVYPHVKKRALVPGGFTFQIITKHGGLTPDQIANLDKSLGVGFRLPVEISQIAPHIVEARVQWSSPLEESRDFKGNISSDSAGDSLVVPVGRDRLGNEVTLDFAAPYHLAIQGQSRSGKSVLVYDILARLAWFPNVRVCGADPTGVLLGPWLPNDGIAIGTGDLEATATVTDSWVTEMESRISELLSMGKDKIDDFTADYPLQVIVLEEYPGLLSALKADDAAQGRKPQERLAPRVTANIRRIIQEGAKVGYRIILLAQRMDAEIVGGAERSNLGARFTLRVDNADAVKMLHPSASPDVIDFVGTALPGQGIYEMPGVPATHFKSDYIDYESYSREVREALDRRNQA